MIPAAFDYRLAAGLEEAVSLLAGNEDAKLLAGGHSLLPLMRLRLARPSLLVDIGGLRRQLSFIRDEDGWIVVGAMTRHHELTTSPVLRHRLPLLAHAAGMVGDPQVRHRGTIGGSLAHADPAGDLPAALVALDGVVVARGPGGQREIPAARLFSGFLETDLRPDEVLVDVRVPTPAMGHGWAYIKFNRRARDWATVAVAAVVERSGEAVSRVAVGLANMGQTPLRARGVEEALTGGGPDAVPDAAERAADGTAPVDDLAASADFRRHLARVLTRRALGEALSRSSR